MNFIRRNCVIVVVFKLRRLIVETSYKVFCLLLLSIDFEAVTGLGLGRFLGCSEYNLPLRGGLACCSVRELLCVNW